ncbi:MAG: pyridoxamine 5'-phosphate oxidase family protein [Chloroflexi bacterium]|nr:pyridoxamine 5'-phosphate oxidase family protein [Chloroflexota bacterium]
MISLTDEMQELINNSLANGTPCILATASLKGEPSVSFRGSLMVFDTEHLAYWDRSHRAAIEHIRENPKVAVMFRDPARKKGWRFFGEATLHEDGAIRQQVMERVVERELGMDPERKGVAVLIKVNKVTTTGGQVLQERG